MTSVLLADDHAFIRTGVEAVLAQTDFHMVAAVGSGAEALVAVKQHNPDICVFDVAMPDGDGVSVLEALRKQGDERPVVLLTAQIDDSRLLDAIEAKVNAVLSKEGAEGLLVETLAKVIAGEQVIAPDLAERARNEAARRRVPSPFATLTPRERTIVTFVAQGQRNRDIARELGITEGTVKVYLHSLYQKLSIENRTELAVLVLKQGKGPGQPL